MSGVNWQKNFSHCSISSSVAPSSMQKLCTPLATIFVEKKFWKKFWCGFRPIWVTPWREFLISWKKWRFEIFRTTAESRASDPWIEIPSYWPCLFSDLRCILPQPIYLNSISLEKSVYPCIYLSMDDWLWIPQSFEKFQNAIFFMISKIPFMG